MFVGALAARWERGPILALFIQIALSRGCRVDVGGGSTEREILRKVGIGGRVRSAVAV